MGGGTGRKNAAGRMDHGGRWRAEKQWPLPETVSTSFYLHGDGGLSESAPPGNSPPRSFDYDPRHPVPTIGGTVTSGQPVMVGGAFDQRESPAFFGSRPPYAAAGRARRRAGLSDFAARKRRRGDGCDRSRAVDRVELSGHGLHDQVDRRVPAERRLSARVRDESDRRHSALSLSRFVGAPDADDARDRSTVSR